ncbi:aldehyde ferredoxin oxidoreductase family protein [Thermodesulfobacteriota bacterium]
MALKYGYAGTILKVNLSNKSIDMIALDESLANNFVGGIGISTKLFYDSMKPGIDPLSPENVFIIGSGALGGTLAPTSARAEVLSKSPQSGFIGWANTGNSVANMLKYAGYDQLVVTGAADAPVYLKVDDDDIEICDAGHLWGKDTSETVEMLWKELGKDYQITCIGPAGENTVRYACTISQKHSAAARTGMGAVMGSKKLKAIAARGTKGIKVADTKRFLTLVEEAQNRFRMKEKLVLAWRTYGFLAGFLKMVDSQEYLRLKGGYYACKSCPVACNAWLNIPDGEYAGLSFLASAPGTKIVVDLTNGSPIGRYDEIFNIQQIVNRYGMDFFSTMALCTFAMGLYKDGIIGKEDTGGLELKKDPETIKALITKIAKREGIGDILAEGLSRAAAKIGKGAEQYDVSIRGVDATDIKGGRLGATETFGFVTNPRGGMMERSTSISFAKRERKSYVQYCSAIGVPEEAVDRVCHGPEGHNTPRLTRYTEDILTLVAMQGLCRRAPVAAVWDVGLHADFYSAATGIEMTDSDLLKCAERVWNLQKCFNIREGATRVDDRFPSRALPMTLGGKVLDENTMDDWLNEYYEERGWDVETGRPGKQKLASLGLDDVAQELEQLRLTK